MLKKMKMDTDAPPVPGSSAVTNGKGKRAVTLEELPEEDDPMEGPSSDFAPGGDADYFAEEDNEGRFYGGGLTSEQKEILNIFDSAGGEGQQDDVRSVPHSTICS